LARKGIEPDWYQALTLAVHAEELAAFPETARVYLRNGHYIYRPPTIADGDRIVFPDLARSLECLAKRGPDAFYRGPIADAIAEEMRAHGGFLTRADLAAYQARIHPPLQGRYRNLELAFSPWATGGITALEILNILACYPSAEVGWESSRGLHLRAEAVRYAFLDRFAHLGDPAQVEAPWRTLASPAYAEALAKRLRRTRSPQAAPDPWSFEGRPAPRATTARP
jgi:gamma-glutamyltranspeptidase